MHENREQQWLLTEKYGGFLCVEFTADCERLALGEPLAYVIGFVPFLGCKIWLESKPLIPRPETEFWVEKAIEEIKGAISARVAREARAKDLLSRRNLDIERLLTSLPETKYALKQAQSRSNLDIGGVGGGKVASSSPLRILDLCAGSGCIGVAVAHRVPEARVDFCEIDAGHHSQILKNMRTNHIAEERCVIFGGDLFENITGTYDFIFSNPPYIDPELAERIGKDVLAHEPHRALFGGEGGMALIKRIISEAPQHLTPDGVLYIEHEPEQVEATLSLARSANFARIATLPDQYGVMRTTRLALTPRPVAQ